MKPPRATEQEHTPDLTPMIDIVFLLIVFFMTVAHLKSEEMIAVNIPIAEESAMPEERGIRTTVTVDASGSIFFGTRPVSLDELTSLLAASRTSGQDFPVNLRVDASVPYREIRAILDACAAAGAANIIFASYQSDL
jgi:biopolymer transport protein ExbD